MIEKATNELDELLKSMSPDELNNYYKDNGQYMADEKKGFSYYFKDVLATKHIRLKDVYQMADVSESYGSQILAMEKHTKSRDLIIRLCVAGHFQIQEINRALKLYGMSPLYSKDRRDACIIVAINNRKFDVYEINEMLAKQDLEPLIINE